MKRRKLTRFLSGVMAVAMIGSLAACGGGDTGTTTSDSGAAAESTGDSTADNGASTAPVSALSEIPINEPGTDATGHEGEQAPEGIQEGTTFTYWTNYEIPLYAPWMDNRAAVLSYQIMLTF